MPGHTGDRRSKAIGLKADIILLLCVSWLIGMKTWHNKVQEAEEKGVTGSMDWLGDGGDHRPTELYEKVYTERKKDGEKDSSRSGIT